MSQSSAERDARVSRLAALSKEVRAEFARLRAIVSSLYRKKPEPGVSEPASPRKAREPRSGDDPAEVAIWDDPSAHGVLPAQYMRNEVMRDLAMHIRQERDFKARARGAQEWPSYMSGYISGLAHCMRYMGNTDWVNFDEAWADKVHAELGTPMSEPYAWPQWPGEVLSHERANAEAAQA